jgi:hypothetical protein
VSASSTGTGYDSVDAGTPGVGGRRFAFGSPADLEPGEGLSDQRGTPSAWQHGAPFSADEVETNAPDVTIQIGKEGP